MERQIACHYCRNPTKIAFDPGKQGVVCEKCQAKYRLFAYATSSEDSIGEIPDDYSSLVERALTLALHHKSAAERRRETKVEVEPRRWPFRSKTRKPTLGEAAEETVSDLEELLRVIQQLDEAFQYDPRIVMFDMNLIQYLNAQVTYHDCNSSHFVTMMTSRDRVEIAASSRDANQAEVLAKHSLSQFQNATKELATREGVQFLPSVGLTSSHLIWLYLDDLADELS